MGNALQAVLHLKDQEQKAEQFRSQQITQAVDIFQNAQELGQRKQLQDAQVANLLSEAKARQGQETINNLMKASQLKHLGREDNDKATYDMGVILQKSALGLPASTNQYLGEAGKMMPPTSLNPTEKGVDPTMELQLQATETDWSGRSTPAALEAKRKLEIESAKEKKAALETPEEKQTATLQLDELKRKATEATPEGEARKLEYMKKEQDIKEASTKEENVKREEIKLKNEQAFSQDLLDTLSEVEKGIKYFGAAGSIPPLPGEYDKVNWRANYEKLISKNVLDELADLKNQSKTGATGFGQLSNKELSVLMNAATVLKKDMSEEDAARYLKMMKEPLSKIMGTKKQEEKTSTEWASDKEARYQAWKAKKK